MLHFMILTVGAMLAVSVLTGMLLGYAKRRNLLETRLFFRHGFVPGLVTAAALALLEAASAIVVREYYNLAVLCTALTAEAWLLFLLAVKPPLPPEKAPSLSLRAAFCIVLAAWGAFYLPDLFIYPSHFAVGVVEIASSEFVFIVTGYLAGLALSLLVGYSLFRVCTDLPEKTSFPLFSLAFALFVLTQVVTIGQILLGRGLVPRRDWALDSLIFLLNRAPLALYLILGAAALAAALLWRHSAASRPEGANPALRRKAQSVIRKSIRWSGAALVFLTTALLLMTAGARFDALEAEISPPVEMAVKNGLIAHPASLVGDGALHRFIYKSNKGVGVRYIIVKKSETAYGVGLDACDVCGPSGYYERKGQIICTLCDVVMNKSTIGFAGGCNPVPLKFFLQDGSLIIKTADLEAQASRFM
ncbi:MAG: DUF2318 domain-containing protein [Desulfovibrio sp.]|jgi:uncharacterized membrane protein|nr:DUF2318 domain-containing protein [Desulfovibrio sp.]